MDFGRASCAPTVPNFGSQILWYMNNNFVNLLYKNSCWGRYARHECSAITPNRGISTIQYTDWTWSNSCKKLRFCTEVPEGIVNLLPKCRGDRCGRTNVLHKTLEKFMKAWQSWCCWTTPHLWLLGSGPSLSSACTPSMHLIQTWMLLERYLDKQLVTISVILMYLECNFVLFSLRNAGCQGKGTPAEPEY
jgi:hypothetical protein